MSLLRAVISVILDIKVGQFEVAVAVLQNWSISYPYKKEDSITSRK